MTTGQMDYRKIDSRSKLRKLELEAYSSLVNAFRAQGNFTKEKKKILNELRSFLSISIERHQAEIRRSVNDEKLSKISACLNGKDQLDAWVIEGRRVIPLLKRMAPKTGVSAIADKVARYQVKQNQLETVLRANNSVSNNEQSSSFELEEQLSGRASNSTNSPANVAPIQATRKRVNSCESSTTKRKYQVSSKSKEASLKQHSNRLANSSTPTSALSTITIPASSLSGGCSKSENSVLTAADKPGQPKLLIMSTGSTLNKPTIVNTSALSGDQHQQLINLDLDASASKHQLQSIPQPITLVTTSGGNKFSEAPVSSSQAHLIATSQSAKVYNPKVQSTSPKLMILPNSSQTKTLTIPISHKTLQLPAQNLPNSTILYSQQPIVTGTAGGLVNCSTGGTLKSMSGITIQAIKTTQSGSKSNSNFIIMPNKAANSGGAQQLSQAAVSGAKGLLRQVNAKEFPVKFISTAPDGLTKKESTDRPDPNDKLPQQQTIILTNVSKETANSLTGSPIRNLVGHPIIKVVPKSATSNSMQQVNKANAGRQTSPNQKAFHPITIPAGNATAFMEILKNIPINRLPQQLSNSDGKTTQISITQNPNSTGSTITKTIKIPANSTSESISKLIFNNVMTGNSLSNASSPVESTRKAPKSGVSIVTDVKGGLVNSSLVNSGPVSSETVNSGPVSNETVNETVNCETVKTDKGNQSASEKSETDKNLLVDDVVDEQSIKNENCDLVEENVSEDAARNDTASTESISLNDSHEKQSLDEQPGLSSTDQVVESTT